MGYLRSLFTLTLILLGLNLYGESKKSKLEYKVPEQTWNESFGNHRAVIEIKKPAEAVILDYKWRRHDEAIDNTRFLIINAQNGDTIKNIRRLKVNKEECLIQFGPVSQSGKYYFYYLPYPVQYESGFTRGGYYAPENEPDKEWENKISSLKKIEKAKILSVESRTPFDSFYPMEIPATKNEEQDYIKSNWEKFYLFAEDRSNPIRMRDAIPVKWLDYVQGHQFSGTAAPNEYYTFQVGVWSPRANIDHLSYSVTPLRGTSGTINPSDITCFNLQGVDPYGNHFTKTVDVKKGTVQPLWFGIDIPENQPAGKYTGILTISDSSGTSFSIPLSINIEGKKLEDRGDSNPKMMTRLRWLNSTLGIADTPISPYTPVKVEGDTLFCLNREVIIDPSTGLPSQIVSFDHNILASPIRFLITLNDNRTLDIKGEFEIKEKTEGHIKIGLSASDQLLDLVMDAIFDFDGRMDYKIILMAKESLSISDIRLELPVRPEIASYFMGIGLPGQDMPQSYDGTWKNPEKTVNHVGVSLPTSEQKQWLWPFDSYWIGNAFAGLHMELRGSDYTGPLLNVYRPKFPVSWDNDGKGGFSIRTSPEEVTVTAYSGSRNLDAGQSLNFEFAFIITPVKEINMPAQFTDRYYHNGDRPMPSQEELDKGVKIVNVHHGTRVNPFINYPFLTPDSLRAFTDTLHSKGSKVKVYYTLRELSDALPELWAIRSLGNEVFRSGDGGGYNWLREHLVNDYKPQWYVHFNGENPSDVSADAAILISETDSRWYNYYIEGLAWMIRNLDIDGIYLDDVSFDRRILKRMRRAMEEVKPGTIIDLHSNTGFSIGAANQYAEFFPYIDKLWFGESFLYDKMTPANWLVESSGIPFGLTGDMLYRGGNPWLGMQYGMTVRYPWYTEGVNCDPTEIWKIWDDFGIDNSQMIGFWEENVPVTASDQDVKVTVYKKDDGKLLLSMGNYTDENKNVNLIFNWEDLGLNPEEVKLIAPFIKDFQSNQEFSLDEEIQIEPRKGWLLYVEKL